MSFLVGGVLPYGKLTPHTLGSSVAAWESGTMPRKVIFPQVQSWRGTCSWERCWLRDRGGRGWGNLRMLLCGFWSIFEKLFFFFYQNKHYEVTYVDSAFTSYILRLNLPIGVDSPSDVRHVLSINVTVVSTGLFQSSHQTQHSSWTFAKVVAAALPSSLAPRVWFLFYCVCSQVSSGIEWSVHAL